MTVLYLTIFFNKAAHSSDINIYRQHSHKLTFSYKGRKFNPIAYFRANDAINAINVSNFALNALFVWFFIMTEKKSRKIKEMLTKENMSSSMMSLVYWSGGGPHHDNN